MGSNYFGESCVLRDRKLGKTYVSKDSGRYEVTDMLLHNLRDNFPQTNFIGIRVLPSREGGSFIRRYCGYETDATEKMMRRWKKKGLLQSLHLDIILILVWHHLHLTMMES